MKYIATIGDQTFTMSIEGNGVVRVDGVVVAADLLASLDGTLHSLIVDGRSYALRIQPLEGSYRIQVGGELHDVGIMDERTHRLAGLTGLLDAQSGEVVMRVPMPGVIVEVPIKEGDAVEKGQTLVVLESMKMHNEFMAPRAGTIHSIRVTKGKRIEKNSVMLTLA